VQIEFVLIIYAVENVGVGLGDHALVSSSEVALGAEFCLERRANAVVKLCSCAPRHLSNCRPSSAGDLHVGLQARPRQELNHLARTE
jgi:hypothetical protein